jgi:hypothetical protein
VSAQVSATPVPGVSVTPAASPAAPASPSPARSGYAAIPKPSLKPGEVITWVKLARPRLALGEILVGSFALAGLVLVVSMVAGVILGHFRSKRTNTHGTQGLGLR